MKYAGFALVLWLVAVPALADPLTTGVYQRADNIGAGERGFACLCTSGFEATAGTLQATTGEERPVLTITAAPQGRDDEIGRRFWPERTDSAQMTTIPQE